MNTIDESFTIILPVSTVPKKNSVRVRTALLDDNGNV